LATAQREYAYLLDAGTGRILQQIHVPSSALFDVAAFSADGTRIVIGDWAKCALLWRLADDRVLTLSGHTAPVRTASFSGDGALVLTAGEDGVIKIWDAANGDLLDSFVAHDGAIERDHARFSPDGRGIFSTGSDGRARLWPVPDETRSADAIAAILECRAPWRVDGGKLVPRAIDAAACGAAPRK
jgi:WD40 repeat protein